MKFIAAIALGAGLASCAGAARAETAGSKVFGCDIGGKQVSVTKFGGRFVYRFGTGATSDLTVVGDPAAGNVFKLRQRFAGPETQVRFTNGEFSYIVFAAEGNSISGARSIAGVTVMRGLKQIAFLTCARFTSFENFDEVFSAAPQDDAAHSGM